MPFCIGWVKNFDEITLSCTVNKIEANSCFSIFGKNLKISTKSLYLARLRRYWQICVLPFLAKIRKFKMAAIFGEGKIFCKLQRLHSSDTLWVENFDEIALSRSVKEIEANLCFAIVGKNSKIQNGRHFWGGENFL